jgi:hypothetical protein
MANGTRYIVRLEQALYDAKCVLAETCMAIEVNDHLVWRSREAVDASRALLNRIAEGMRDRAD